MKMKNTFLLSALIIGFTPLMAQDDCFTAVALPSVNNWCSADAAYTNTGATSSNFPAPACFGNINNDVWYSFVAVGPDVSVQVAGNEFPAPGGTLTRPEVALYTGSCSSTSSNLTMLNCEAAPFGVNFVNLYRGGLTPGQTYYLRINGQNSTTGTFRLCVNSYAAPAVASSDCINGAILCDKNPFTVQGIQGGGNNPDEAAGSCLALGSNSESNSIWYRWTCDQSGSLTFNLAPTFPSDDLDFALYEMSSIDGCGSKSLIRCSAAGDNASGYPSSPCLGVTGLVNGANDTDESSGCSLGQDGDLSPINMVSGRHYALVVNNAMQNDVSFNISFGGTGTFLGPEPLFNISQLGACNGNGVATITDGSTFANGSIVSWHWNFGVGATPADANTQGPHNVTYNAPGFHVITLTIETDRGCIVSRSVNFNVAEPVQYSATHTDMPCADNPSGTITMTQTGGNGNLTYVWADGATGPNRTNLAAGTYNVTISNGTCNKDTAIVISAPPLYNIQSVSTLATCGGGTDGTITLNVGGATPPYTYAWSNGANTANIQNLAIGNYDVTITDALGCQQVRNLAVNELELVINPNATTITDPLCFGSSSGSIAIVMGNGLAPYDYAWSNGGTSATLQNLPAGTYSLTVTDANFCTGTIDTVLVDPPLLTVSADSINISCFGENDGVATATVNGGTPPYTYSWNTAPFQTTATINALPPRTYAVIVTDNNGCVATNATTVIEPEPLFIRDAVPTNVRCFGETSGTITITVGGGTGPFEFSADGVNYQADTVIRNLAAGVYDVRVRDSRGCEAFFSNVPITEPFQLVVDAGLDRSINLGDTIHIAATVNSVFVQTYQWTPAQYLDCDVCKQTFGQPVQTMTYSVLATDDKGCTATDAFNVFVNPVRPLYIPNAFTPSGDGLNDTFRAYGGSAVRQVRSLKVFDRWGELVFATSNQSLESAAWDGTFKGRAMNPGVFVYIFEVEFLDGFVQSYKGDVTLIL